MTNKEIKEFENDMRLAPLFKQFKTLQWVFGAIEKDIGKVKKGTDEFEEICLRQFSVVKQIVRIADAINKILEKYNAPQWNGVFLDQCRSWIEVEVA